MNYQERQKKAFIALNKMKEAREILSSLKDFIPKTVGEFDSDFNYISQNPVYEEVEIKDFDDALSTLNTAIIQVGAYATRQIGVD